MDRRAAIKNISLAFGYTITAPVLMNILKYINLIQLLIALSTKPFTYYILSVFLFFFLI